ncbi:uncharacterized protein LOC126888381 isoform X1 [Diabrotica virgifera virgifera]|uniref:Uncharacterized protein n=1 Tax=Diabrotica virgifera virgifera TaxID=50390 RepID=A0ABM5KQR7_DIAVI|nr:uncharacterized protein LOC126888381 isoform X1 [Diabrotica virgifera virgifera]
MRFTAVLAFLAYLAALTAAQYNFGVFGDPFRGFGGGLGAIQATRDPRQNTGPVVFPPAPPDSGETSGVVVGASGYGFVPPQRSPYHSFFSYF